MFIRISDCTSARFTTRGPQGRYHPLHDSADRYFATPRRRRPKIGSLWEIIFNDPIGKVNALTVRSALGHPIFQFVDETGDPTMIDPNSDLIASAKKIADAPE